MWGLKFRFIVVYILVCTKQNVRIDWIEFCTKKTYAFNLNSKHCPLVFSYLRPISMLWLLRNLRGNWTLNISRNFLLKIHILEKPSLWILCQECKLKPVPNIILPPLQQSSVALVTPPGSFDCQQVYPPEVDKLDKTLTVKKPLQVFFSMGGATSDR